VLLNKESDEALSHPLLRISCQYVHVLPLNLHTSDCYKLTKLLDPLAFRK